MADEPQTVPGPDEEAKEQEKKRKSPKPKFGQILDLGGQYWTIQSSDDGKVTVSRRVGDTMDTRTINEKEYESAATRPLPKNLGSSKPPKGLSVGSYIDAGRVSGYDATTGEVLVESSKGSSWISHNEMSAGSSPLYKDDSDAKGGPSGLTGVRTHGGQTDDAGEKESLVDRKVRENLSDLTYGLISKNKKTKGAASAEVGQGNKEEAKSNEVISNKDEVEAVEAEVTEPIEESFEEEVKESEEKRAELLKTAQLIDLMERVSKQGLDRTLSYAKNSGIEDDVLHHELIRGAVQSRLHLDFELLDVEEVAAAARAFGVSEEAIRAAAAQAVPFLVSSGISKPLRQVEKTFGPINSLVSNAELEHAMAILEKEKENRTFPEEYLAVKELVERTLKTPEAVLPSPVQTVRVSRTVKVGDAPKSAAPPSVKISTTVPVGQAPKEPSIRETRVQLKTQVERAKSTPSPTGIRATLSVPTASATPAAAALGVAGAALGAITAGTMQASPAAAIEQQALYAKAMHALDVVSTRAAEKRGSIRDLQTQADGLRREVSGLNAQAAASATGGAYQASDASGRIQQVSTRLGSVQNKLAMARYGLQTDEAQAQQLRIATNLMKNLAPEVQRGQVPNSIVGLVAQSIPSDIPDPSTQRAVALIATLGASFPQPPPQVEEVAEGVAVETAVPSEAPSPRSFATSAPSAAERPTPASTTGLPESFRARPALTLPQATAVAFSAGQQADRVAGGYQEGVGAPDAREAAFATEGGGAQPVMKTIQASYTRPERPDLAQDLYEPGGEGASEDFMRRQRESLATQEQFQPGTTGGPEAATFVPETERAQRVRPGEEGPDEDALRAAKFQADQARARAAALQVLDVSEEEETRLNLSRKQQAFKQLESAKRNFSHLMDLFNTAHGLVDVIGIFAVLANMNMRVLTIKFRKGSMTRKFFPPAQFPIEVAGIVAMDIILFTVVFVSFCIAIAPFIIFWTAIGTGIGGLIYAVTSVAS